MGDMRFLSFVSATMRVVILFEDSREEDKTGSGEHWRR